MTGAENNPDLIHTRARYPVPVSRLEKVLRGLDPVFALTELAERQGPKIHDKYRQSRIIELRFGLNGGWPMYLKDVAYQFGSSIEVIRKNEKDALSKLRVIRDEVRPEAVFPREEIPTIDRSDLYPNPVLDSDEIPQKPVFDYEGEPLRSRIREAYRLLVLLGLRDTSASGESKS